MIYIYYVKYNVYLIKAIVYNNLNSFSEMGIKYFKSSFG